MVTTETGLTPHMHLVEVADAKKAAARTLPHLAQFYMATAVAGKSGHTVEAKKRDLQRFLDFFADLYGDDQSPARWFPAVTDAWLRELYRSELKPSTVARTYSSVRHFARWAVSQGVEFPAGHPTQGVTPPKEPEPAWRGLARKDQLRLIAAAAMLKAPARRYGSDTGSRDLALLHVLLGTGLRVSEACRLEVPQWTGQGFHDVLAKGTDTRSFVRLWGVAARKAVKQWLEARSALPASDPSGPIFLTRSGKPIGRRQAGKIVQKFARQANAQLAEAEQFTVSPHTLRHALLRRLTDGKGERFAKKQSGHRSDKYLYRYIQPAEDEMRTADDFE